MADDWLVARPGEKLGGYGGLALLTALVCALAAFALAPRAEAYVYWANDGGGVGRATLGGEGVSQSFIPSSAAGRPCDVAVSPSHLYYADIANPHAIGRANIDGSGIEDQFLPTLSTCGVALDATHIFFARQTRIGRANLDATGQNHAFITDAGISLCTGLDVDDSHLYWVDSLGGSAGGGDGRIGRAEKDGSNVEPGWIPSAGIGACGVTVTGSHVYWGDLFRVVRANLDGSGQTNLVTNASGMSRACGVAVDNKYVYWADPNLDTIGRARLDGSHAQPSFITGATRPCGVAVNALGPPGCESLSESTGFEQAVGVTLFCGGSEPLTYETVDGPDGGEISGFNPATGTLTYTPDEGFSGDDSFTYRASGPTGDSNTATVTIAVDPPPPPSCEDVGEATAYATPVEVTLDCAGDAFTYEIVEDPENGTLDEADIADGKVTYTPDSGFTGDDSFTYRATNAGGASDPATAEITVDPPPAPTCEEVAETTDYATPVEVTLDCAGVDLELEIVDGPSDGTLDESELAAGKVTYTPDSGFTGDDGFLYRATNPGGDSSATLAEITVDPPPAPSCTDVAGSTAFRTQVEVVLDCAGLDLDYEIVSQPGGGALDESRLDQGIVAYTPGPGFSGADTFSFRAVNPGGAGAPATARIEVGSRACPTVRAFAAPARRFGGKRLVGRTRLGVRASARARGGAARVRITAFVRRGGALRRLGSTAFALPRGKRVRFGIAVPLRLRGQLAPGARVRALFRLRTTPRKPGCGAVTRSQRWIRVQVKQVAVGLLRR